MSFAFFDRRLSMLLLVQVLLIQVLWLLGSRVQADDIHLYAAASLTDVLSELSDVYQQQHPNISIKKSFAGSSILAKQIEHGAPADIFISADKDWVDYVQKRGLLNDQSRKKLLTNELVLIAPKLSNFTPVLDPAFPLNARFQGRLCTGDPTSVPVGRYAKQALTHYKWWAEIETRIVGTDDVRTALAFVERGECALGVVYKTDALLSKNVKVLATFPAESHAPIQYPGALTKFANAESNAFWAFLQSNEAKAVFIRHGFNPLH